MSLLIGLVLYLLGGAVTCYMLGRSMTEGKVNGAQALGFFAVWPVFLPIASIALGITYKMRHSDEQERP